MKIHNYLQFFLLIAIVGGSRSELISEHHLNSGFANFLEQTLNEYPAWLRSKNLDPIPAVSSELIINYEGPLLSFYGRGWNETISGHSNGNTFSIDEVNLLAGRFHIRQTTGELLLSGEYEMEGSALSNVPVRASGNFSGIDQNYREVYLDVDGFGMTSDGFIDLSTANVTHTQYFVFRDVRFEGIEARGLEEEVEEILWDYYTESTPFVKIFPLSLTMYNYLEEVFAKTPIDTIIGTPPQPSY